MSRNDLVNALTSEDGQYRSTEDAKAMLDTFEASVTRKVLREAASKIRAEATKMDDPGPSQTIRRAGIRLAADLIDPDKAKS